MAVPIFKKGDRNDCDNYKGSVYLICLTVCICLLQTYAKRLFSNAITETIVWKAQHGFRQGRSCLDVTAQVIGKDREYQLSTSSTLEKHFIE